MSGLKVKRNNLRNKHKTPDKKTLRKQRIEEMVAPMVRAVKKMSKGQIRRNVGSNAGNLTLPNNRNITRR